jgi:hypothetical protein
MDSSNNTDNSDANLFTCDSPVWIVPHGFCSGLHAGRPDPDWPMAAGFAAFRRWNAFMRESVVTFKLRL